MKEKFKIDLSKVTLEGEFTLVSNPKGLIVFAQGNGSGRYNPRYNFVAQYLNKQGYLTLLLDLYARQDPELHPKDFHPEILANRLREVTVRLKSMANLSKLPFGLYGSNTGAAVALLAASYLKKRVQAVVIKGGRTDLTDDVLNLIQAPTLLLVGENDPSTKDLNRKSLPLINAPKALKIIPNASDLYEEAGVLESIALETEAWFKIHLKNPERVKKSRVSL